jgi:hypothetical protein
MAETIRLDIRLEKRDYLRAARGRFWRSLGWVVAFAPLLALLPFWRAKALQHEVAQWNAAALALAAGLYCALALFLAFSIETCARMFSQHAVRRTPLGLESQVVTFSEKGMEAVTERSSGSVAWNGIQKATVSNWAFQLHIGPQQYVLLPFRQIPSAELRDRLREMIKQHLGARAKFRA